MRCLLKPLLGGFALLALAVAPLRLPSDTITLANGRTMEGLIVQEDEQVVVIETLGGTMRFPRSSISSVTRQSPWEYHLARGDQLFQQGNLERAREAYQQVETTARAEGALTEQLQQQLQGRLDQLEERLHDQSAEIYRSVISEAEGLTAEHRYDEALAVLQEAIAAAGSNMPTDVLVEQQAQVLLAKAEHQIDLVNTRRAIETLRQAVILNPDLAEAQRLLGLRLADQNRSDPQAIEHLQRAIELMGDDTQPEIISEAQYRLAESLQAVGRQIEASEAYAAVHRRSGYQYPNALRRAVDTVLEWSANRPVTPQTLPELREALTRAHELDPTRVEPLNRLVAVCRQAGEPQEALQYCRRSLQLEGTQARMHEQMGELILEIDDTNLIEAERAFNSALRNNPNLYSAHCSLAALKERAGEYAAAIAHCGQAIEINDSFPRAFMLRGRAQMAQDIDANADRAIGDLEEAIARSSRFIEPLLLLGEVYTHRQNFDRASGYYNSVIEVVEGEEVLEDRDVNSLLAQCHIGLGEIRLREGSLNQARDHAHEAMSVDPTSSWAHSLLGRIHEANERWEQAREEYERAIELEPEEPHFYYQLGLLYYEPLQDLDRAEENFRLYLANDGADYIGIQRLLNNVGRSL